MSRIYSEDDITWSSIEKYIPYSKVEWSTNKNGISTYKFFDEEGSDLQMYSNPKKKEIPNFYFNKNFSLLIFYNTLRKKSTLLVDFFIPF